MNIMLVSVDERIREIGLRRRLGAKKWQIKLQFLAETLPSCCWARGAGALLSYGIAADLPLMGPLCPARPTSICRFRWPWLCFPLSCCWRSELPAAWCRRCVEVGICRSATLRIDACHPQEAELFATRRAPDEGPLHFGLVRCAKLEWTQHRAWRGMQGSFCGCPGFAGR